MNFLGYVDAEYAEFAGLSLYRQEEHERGSNIIAVLDVLVTVLHVTVAQSMC